MIGAKQEEERVLKNNDELKIGCFKRLQHDMAQPLEITEELNRVDVDISEVGRLSKEFY